MSRRTPSPDATRAGKPSSPLLAPPAAPPAPPERKRAKVANAKISEVPWAWTKDDEAAEPVATIAYGPVPASSSSAPAAQPVPHGTWPTGSALGYQDADAAAWSSWAWNRYNMGTSWSMHSTTQVYGVQNPWGFSPPPSPYPVWPSPWPYTYPAGTGSPGHERAPSRGN